MPDYCKNCGAKITKNTLTCPDCGKPIERKNTCPKCGGQVLNGNYCANCGCNIKETKIPKKRNNTLIILIAVAVALAVIGAALFFQVELVESQEVQVDTINFSIPASFEEDPFMGEEETDEGVLTVSRYWMDSSDFIEIDVMYSPNSDVDANKVNDKLGGIKENMMGCDGYYNELIDAYSFTFVKDNKLCTVYTSNYDLFEKIEVL